MLFNPHPITAIRVDLASVVAICHRFRRSRSPPPSCSFAALLFCGGWLVLLVLQCCFSRHHHHLRLDHAYGPCSWPYFCLVIFLFMFVHPMQVQIFFVRQPNSLCLVNHISIVFGAIQPSRSFLAFLINFLSTWLLIFLI
jgi:hypothetical protein